LRHVPFPKKTLRGYELLLWPSFLIHQPARGAPAKMIPVTAQALPFWHTQLD